MLQRSTVSLLASLALFALVAGCSKPKGDAPPASTAAAESAQLIADFTSTDPSLWVNGAPMSLASARGSVVLIEAWGVW